MRTYTYDKTALNDDGGYGTYIEGAGLYSVEITDAWYEKNDKGTESVCLKVADVEHGNTAGPLRLMTHNGKGDTLPDYRKLNSLLRCTDVAKLEPSKGTVNLYDFDSGARRDMEREVFPSLKGKKVWLALQPEEYFNNQGLSKTALKIFDFFRLSDKKSAQEIAGGKAQAQGFEQCINYLRAHPVKMAKNVATGGSAQATRMTSAPAADAFTDDDIPF